MNARVKELRERVISHSFRGTEFADKRIYLDVESEILDGVVPANRW